MIFSECKCGEFVSIGWEAGMKHGFYRNECEKCGEITFYECTSLPNGEVLSEKEFWEKHPEAIQPSIIQS